MQNDPLTFAEFERVEMRIGTIISAVPFDGARKPAYQLQIDFGEIGILRSSAQLTKSYTCGDLAGKQIVAVVNFPKKQIANFISECLVLGAVDEDGGVNLLIPDFPSINGLRIA